MGKGINLNLNNSQLAHLLAVDWLLEARTTIWERQQSVEDVSQYALSRFQADLNLLRIIAEGNAVSGQVICVK